MRLKMLGTGDAFGSGGRFNTCFLIDRGESNFLVDCGASSMIAIRKFGVDPNSIGTIILSHLHADHFGCVPSFILDGQLVSRRTRSLAIAGPQGLRARLDALMEAHFPGSSTIERKFQLNLIELLPEIPTPISVGVDATAYAVVHPSGTPSLALRIECDDKVLGYTGDTEWTDALIEAGRDADLFIVECYTYDRKVRFHMDYATLKEKLPRIKAKRVILTHMSSEMIGRASTIHELDIGFDGLDIAIE